ncbi:MAG TPA: hypothetical protein VK173_10305 [Lacibacter sp.]|nr:hypothetical protein [Lacibacter sp.]
MNNIVRLVFFYFLNIVAFVFISIVFGGRLSYLFKDFGILVMPLFSIIPALILGFIIMVIVNKNEKNSNIFTISHIICTTTLMLIVIGTKISNWNHNRKYGNVEANQEYFRNTEYMDMTDYKISFDTLITRFPNPNDIRITGGSGKVIDTIIGSLHHNVRHVRLIYTKNNSSEEYKAEFIVFNSTAYISFFNIPLSRSDKKKIAAEQKKEGKILEDAIKIVEEEIKKKKSEQK